MSKKKRRKTKSGMKRAFSLLMLICFIALLIVLAGKLINPFPDSVRWNEHNSELNINKTEKYDNTSDVSQYNQVSSKVINKGTTIERLNSLKNQDSRIGTILDHYDEYPEDLADMLSRNIEMLDFVLEYKDKQGKVYGDTIGEVNRGTIPFLLQWDKRWGYAYYGEDIIAIDGCGPTALSMVICGLTGDNSITPYKVAKYAEENGFYVAGSGSSWSLMSDGCQYFGIESEELSLQKDLIMNTLENGSPIICIMGAGDFTTTGHFIVLTGIEDGKIKVNDPNSIARSSLLWEYERIAPQIKNLWTFWVED